jgi:hypothetical protein
MNRFYFIALFSICVVRITYGVEDLWSLALQRTNDHRFSVYFEKTDSTDYSTNSINEVIAWCRTNGVTKVYLETFRYDDPQLPKALVVQARNNLWAAGLEVSGGVSTVTVDQHEGTNYTQCYSDPEGQKTVASVFSTAAELFDHVIIDDYLYTKCECPNCQRDLNTRRFTVAQGTYGFTGDTMEKFRRELMYHVSRRLILKPARAMNPEVSVTIKFPKWYDQYQERGYDVVRQTEMFDQIWVGTETRNYDDCWFGGTPQYAAYFLMRWLTGFGGNKTGGGWYDWINTDPQTYIEQARQTILGGARESVLFSYGGLHILNQTSHCESVTVFYPPENMKALRANMRELLDVAGKVGASTHFGVAAYKPVNSGPAQTNEMEIFSFIGMLGIPLEPCHAFPMDAPAAFFSTHALKDPDFRGKLETFIESGKPVLITEGLKASLNSIKNIAAQNVFTLPLDQNATNPAPLLQIDVGRLDAIRTPLLKPFNMAFSAPPKVALYLFQPKDRSVQRNINYVIENFNTTNVPVSLNGKPLNIKARGWLTNFEP